MKQLTRLGNLIQKLRHGPASSDIFNFSRVRSGPNIHKNNEILVKPNTNDVCLAATWDLGRQTEWMQKQFKLMNNFARNALMWAVHSQEHQFDGDKLAAAAAMDKARDLQNQCYILSTAYENIVKRRHNDQTIPEDYKPRKACISWDLVTNFGLSIIMENFMLFNNLRFDTIEVGTGTGTPFGGDMALQTPVASVSILQEGFSLPYGIEARHGAPFLATVVDNTLKEVAVKDSASGKIYSRSVFPSSDYIDHIQSFDTFSILHITQLKAI